MIETIAIFAGVCGGFKIARWWLRRMRVVCVYCNRVIRHGGGRISHGACERCAGEQIAFITALSIRKNRIHETH